MNGLKIKYKDRNGEEKVKYTKNPLIVVPFVLMGVVFAVLAIPFAIVAVLAAAWVTRKD